MDIDKMVLKFVCRGNRPRIANTTLKDNKKVGRLMLLNFQTCSKAAISKME